MPKFRVHVVKETTLYCDVEIDAEDLCEAEETAQQLALEGKLTFNLSDEAGAPYIAEDATEEV